MKTPWTHAVLSNCRYFIAGLRSGSLTGPEAERAAQEAETMLVEAEADGTDVSAYKA